MKREYTDAWEDRPKFLTVADRVWELVRQFGSLAKAEDATGLDRTTLCTLRSGKHRTPHPRILNVLGLKHPAYFERIDDKGSK